MKSALKLFALLPSAVLLFFSCSPKTDLEKALEAAGDNRAPLEGVLAHYAGDSLKWRAAAFLIENLPYHYGYQGEAVDNYRKLFEYQRQTGYKAERVLDTITARYGRFSYDKATVKPDLEIDSAYLVENIDHAFKVWREQPWGKNVPFATFCEFVLPYRVGDEELKPWREKIYARFNPMLDSIRGMPEAEDPLFVAQVLFDSLRNHKKYSFTRKYQGPHVGPDIVDWYVGYCRESSDILMYVFRALGLPCGREFDFLRGDSNVGHEWNFVLSKADSTYFCSLTYDGENVDPADTYWWKKGKAYRQTFGLNKELESQFRSFPKTSIPENFSHPLFFDVTHLYTGKLSKRLTLPMEKLYAPPTRKQPLFLCQASWKDWVPVAFLPRTGKDSLRIENLEGNILYRVGTCSGGAMQLLSDAFVIDKKTSGLHFIEPTDTLAPVTLLTKYTLSSVLPWRMMYSTIEGSDRAGFSRKDTLFMIRRKPVRMWNVGRSRSSRLYRYVRYAARVGDKHHCNVAEVAFYEHWADTVPLKGTVIGTPNSPERQEKHSHTNVFDGDTRTSFDYYLPEGGWVGLDLGTPRRIEKIIYTARNNDNFIRRGNEYELFYDLKGKWYSAGYQKATSDSLAYTVPKGSLLYLRNYTEGNEERVFEYRNGEQVFW